MRRRFRNESIDATHRPVDATAAALYDALSDARLDATSVRWLAGVAANLLAHPGSDDDGLRWLAFECFSKVSAPREKTEGATQARRALSSVLLHGLTAVGTFTNDDARFAEAASAWCAKAAGQAPVPVAAAAARGFNIPTRPAGVDIRRGRYALPGQSRTDANRPVAASEGEHAQGAKQDDVDPVVALIGYCAYTTAFDRVVNAAALPARPFKLEFEFESPFPSTVDGHRAAVIEHIETRSPVTLAAIGIGCAVSQFYRSATRISRIDNLGSALTTKWMALLSE